MMKGGRHTAFVSNYRPQLFTRTADVTCTITLPDDVAMVMPGDNVACTVQLFSDLAIEHGSRFTVREGGKTVATGVVTEIVE
jgi:elongation factor Tu